ncbi:ORF6C domain-containing protein [Brevibacillus invocatus]|uniref:ORF6C domain-containing protein n=1 Tax=Brevibacillus invocatus TaxID=173959 RepID=UPI00203CF9DB|nr:ORF6C domain-containing protein [Brevibacillus invocatus]MCM3079617.1 ORF6C domain-containing protein [Brevibacillus invocatus]MCM3429815.1 ORF6C domain-containing protein [Brevibacillus invocatus]
MSKMQVLAYAGQRVLTTAQLAESYGADSERIQKNFNYNKERYQEGKHYILLQGDDIREFRSNFSISEVAPNVNKLYLWTRKGAWMHAKSLNTDEAWEAYESLVDDYYRAIEDPDSFKNLSSEVKAIFFLDKKTQEIESRVEKLEVTKTIDYGQQLELTNLGRRQVISILEGKNGPAYQDRSLRGKVFSAMWSDFKGYFNVESYKNTRVLDLEKALEYISSWRPQGKLLREIEDANRQLAFS